MKFITIISISFSLFGIYGCATEAKRAQILKDNPGCSMADDWELICPSPFAPDENFDAADLD